MIKIGAFKISRRLFVLLAGLLCVVMLSSAVAVDLYKKSESLTTVVKGPMQEKSAAKPAESIQPLLPPTISPSEPGQPVLERLELVTDQAFGINNKYVPNGWGVQKSRIIRTSTGDLFTVYNSAGLGLQDRAWHLMHQAPGTASWQEIQSGDAGTEPVNILRGPHDEIHLFVWPGTNGQLQHIISTNLGKTFQSAMIAGPWYADQGYSGAGINDKGDIVVFQTGSDRPGTFLWTYYTPESNRWQFHITQIDYRYTYAFSFPGDNNNLTITAMRDVKRNLLGYSQADSGFHYIFNAIKYFYIGNVDDPDHSFKQMLVASVEPQQITDSAITYQSDSYIDTIGRTHILYTNLYDGLDIVHHAIIQDGKLIKDVKLAVSLGRKARIIQDSLGHFYIIAMDESGQTLDIYPGSATDTDGTHLNPAIKLDISRFPGCSDDDYCLMPTFTVPRNGHALSDELDGVYGNYNQQIYFRVRLRG